MKYIEELNIPDKALISLLKESIFDSKLHELCFYDTKEWTHKDLAEKQWIISLEYFILFFAKERK